MRAHLSKLGVVIVLLILPAALCSQEISPAGDGTSSADVTPCANLYMRVEIDKNVKVSAMNPGAVLEGKLSQGVYSKYTEIFPAGSTVRLTVDGSEVRRRAANDHWPWVVNVFTPRREKYPTFKTAYVVLSSGVQVPLRVDFVSMGRDTNVHPETKIARAHHAPSAGYSATFEASAESLEGRPKCGSEKKLDPPPGEIVTIAAGTRAKVILLGNLSASRSREGDVFQARTVQPVLNNSTMVLPEGSVLQGRVVRRIPPRMLSRSGSLLLSFTGVNSPGGTIEPIEAIIAGVEVDKRSRATLDAEGALRGDRPGLGWMLLNLAATGGIAKVTDDGLQLVIEAIVSTATDVSTAGTARIVAAGVSGIFLLTRHGRDMVLPKYTEMEIVFDHPVKFPASPANSLDSE